MGKRLPCLRASERVQSKFIYWGFLLTDGVCLHRWMERRQRRSRRRYDERRGEGEGVGRSLTHSCKHAHIPFPACMLTRACSSICASSGALRGGGAFVWMRTVMRSLAPSLHPLHIRSQITLIKTVRTRWGRRARRKHERSIFTHHNILTATRGNSTHLSPF